jgi:hypothetical protein
MQPHFPFSTKKGLFDEKSFAFTLWVMNLAKSLQGEKESRLSKYALGF